MTGPALQGRRVLVTGGSRGIGRGIAVAMPRAGAHVVTCHRAAGPHVRSLEVELEATGGKHRVLAADVSRATGVDRLLGECRDHLGGLDVVVNNAGDFTPKPYAQLDLAERDATIAGNLSASHLVVHAALPLLAPGASIVNVGSTVGFIGMAGGVHYTAAKTALVGFARSLARELGPDGIRVNVISPGRIETEALIGLPETLQDMQRKQVASFTALRRSGTVAEVAAVAVFLAGPASTYVTGQNIHIDGCV